MADATIDPDELLTHAKEFTRWWYIKTNRGALICHIPTEFEDDNLEETPKEKHTHWVTQTQFEQPPPKSPAPVTAVEKLLEENWIRRVQVYLDKVETHLDVIKLHKQASLANVQIDTGYTLLDDNSAETIKEQQARHVTQI